MRRVLLRALRLVAIAVLMFVLAVVVFRRAVEQSMVFHPDREVRDTPASAKLAFDDVALTAADGVRLHAWHVRVPAAQGLVLFLHGNAGNVSHRVAHAELFALQKLEVLLVDYRGYGRSEGTPSEDGLYRDADAAWAWAASRKVPFVIYGESLGGAIAVELALRHPGTPLVVQSTFTRLAEMADRVFPFGGALTTQRFASVDKIGRIAAPVLVMHGVRDELIPIEMGQRLFAAAREPKEMLTIAEASHTDVLDFCHLEVGARIRTLLAAERPTSSE